jgi:hypothetical protein
MRAHDHSPGNRLLFRFVAINCDFLLDPPHRAISVAMA